MIRGLYYSTHLDDWRSCSSFRSSSVFRSRTHQHNDMYVVYTCTLCVCVSRTCVFFHVLSVFVSLCSFSLCTWQVSLPWRFLSSGSITDICHRYVRRVFTGVSIGRLFVDLCFSFSVRHWVCYFHSTCLGPSVPKRLNVLLSQYMSRSVGPQETKEETKVIVR
jgi:hypothetical protein